MILSFFFVTEFNAPTYLIERIETTATAHKENIDIAIYFKCDWNLKKKK